LWAGFVPSPAAVGAAVGVAAGAHAEANTATISSAAIRSAFVLIFMVDSPIL
jgi:hypothetical protein